MTKNEIEKFELKNRNFINKEVKYNNQKYVLHSLTRNMYPDGSYGLIAKLTDANQSLDVPFENPDDFQIL